MVGEQALGSARAPALIIARALGSAALDFARAPALIIARALGSAALDFSGTGASWSQRRHAFLRGPGRAAARPYGGGGLKGLLCDG